MKKIDINYACPIPWNSMKKIDDANRFCSSCSKNVQNFTADHQFKVEAGQCGRYKLKQVNQINRSFAITKGQLFVLSLATFLGLNSTPLQAQHNNSINQKTTEDTVANMRFTLSGRVINEINGDPLPFANIIIESEEGALISGATSDFDGNFNFSFPVQTSEIHRVRISVSLLGFEHHIIDQVPVQPGKLQLQLSLRPEKHGDPGIIITGLSAPPLIDIHEPYSGKTFSNDDLKNGDR